MFRKSLKTVFVLLLVLAFSGAALALQPQDAISARPAESVYTVTRIDDLNGLLKEIFSPTNIGMLASLMNQEQAQGLALISAFASQIPAKSVLIASGMTAEGPFVQIAASMPDSVRSRLDKVANGSASGVEIVTLLLGDGALMFAAAFEPEVQKGAKGPYYSLQDMVSIAAVDDLLLIASSPADLEASIDALEKKENRLSFKSRFDNPNYLQLHMDMPTVAAFAAMLGEDAMGEPDILTKLFKAPLELEIGLAPKPESVLLSVAVNVLESLADSSRYNEAKPVKGGNLFQAGGGKLYIAISTPLAFRVDDLKAYPEAAESWGNLIEEIEAFNITEGDLEDLLNGSITLAFGSEATVMGSAIPGGYIALTGREGTAAKILGKLMENEELSQAIPLLPLNVDGWNSLFAVHPAVSPISLVFGVAKDTLFVGVVDSDSLAKIPELPAELSKMLDDPLFGVGVVDAAGIWNWLRQEVANPESLLSATMEDDIKGILEHILGADLSVPLIKLWSPELETAFMEFSVVDVPQENRLLPRLVELGQSIIQ